MTKLYSLSLIPLLLFAQMPSSSTYKLQGYGVGSGGTSSSTSATYTLEGISGEQSSGAATGGSLQSKPGFIQAQQANVPVAPTFTNDASWYNKLHFIINTSGNPSDAKFAIAISSDDFSTTSYVQSDNTVGATLGFEDYQTYANWGSGTGEYVIGLSPSTTYKIKVKAYDGKFTESMFGPATAGVATSAPSLTFDIDVASTDTDTDPPFTVGFGDLLPAVVTTATNKIWLDFDTNAESGGKIFIYADSTGLVSTGSSNTITSASTDLATANDGYGARSNSATQSSGGPITASSPYNGASDNVGIVNASIRELYTTSAPITAARTSLVLKAKAKADTPAAPDYTSTLTIVATASF